jgi:tripartite-type tricarboxylate transporter receptor subunit TctC
MHIPTIGKFVIKHTAAIALVLGAFAAQAQSYPERSIKLVIPFPPAGCLLYTSDAADEMD